MSRTPLRHAFLALLFGLGCLLGAAPATAQIKEPGNHPNYVVELEPHFLAQYSRLPYGGDGWGLGLRAAIPFMQNGPVPNINNNIGITFGFDWVTFGNDACTGHLYADFYATSCNATNIWFPVTGQWNFFLTRIISVFGEFGLAARYSSYSYDGTCVNGNPGCNIHDSDVDFFEPVMWGGGRFLFGRMAGLTVRLGYPYVAVGASILF